MVVSGEMSIRHMYAYEGLEIPPYPEENYQPKSRPVSVLHRSTSGDSVDIKEHKVELVNAKGQQTEIILCDDTHDESVGVSRIFDSLKLGNERLFILLGATMGASLLKLFHLAYQMKTGSWVDRSEKQKKYDERERKFSETVKSVVDKNPQIIKILKGAGAVWAGTYAAEFFDFRDFGEDFAYALTDFQKLLVKINEKSLGDLFNLVEVRNKSMALNLHLSQLMLDESDPEGELISKFKVDNEEPEWLFFFGSGHVGVRSDYQNGIRTCSKDLINLAEQTVKNYEKEISGLLDQPTELTEALAFWVLSTSGFSYPLGSFMKRQSFIESNGQKIPYSPRALLWKTLLYRMSQEPNNQALARMAQALVDESKAHRKLVTPLIPELEQHLNNGAAQETINFSGTQGKYRLKIVSGIPHIQELD